MTPEVSRDAGNFLLKHAARNAVLRGDSWGSCGSCDEQAFITTTMISTVSSKTFEVALSDSILGRRRREEVSETTPRDNTDEAFGVEAYLRELRAIIRPLGMISPQAASALEVIVKGILLNSDWAISDRNITIKELGDCAEEIDELRGAMQTIKEAHRRDLAIVGKERAAVERKLELVEQEKASLRQSIEELKLELAQLAPNSQDVDKVKSLMDDFSKLIAAFGDEGARHGKILEDFKVFAHKMASDTSTNIAAARAEDKEGDGGRQLQSYQKGRLVQLQSGELLLRHYDSRDFTSQLWESELTQVDPRATPWLCPSYLRTFHHRYMWESLPPMNVHNLEELLLQIIADLPMLNGAPVQNPIPKFHDCIIDFTLAHSACLEEAELRLYTMFRSTLAYPFMPEDVLSVPPAVHLLRRLLRVSPLSVVIPYPIAAACLACLKRSIQGDKTLQSVILENEEIEITELHTLISEICMPSRKASQGIIEDHKDVVADLIIRALAPYCQGEDDSEQRALGVQDGYWRVMEAVIHTRVQKQCPPIVTFLRRCEQLSVGEGSAEHHLIPAEDMAHEVFAGADLDSVDPNAMAMKFSSPSYRISYDFFACR
ncbi:hypothetical protein FOZ61_007611 [Perkinsus olseni]|uniref:Uncharacterized protein n=1 Tax=Perkinsus olseni TaxID=32597 RepID=A0A7J6M8I0_PEROL|nr:hypothetical protein FOZ61_007611 [Perkinsus olseni]